jgi:hypothetical protein
MSSVEEFLEALLKFQPIEIPVSSSFINSVGVNLSGDAVVTMSSGGTYTISKEQAIGLLTSSSPGRYFNSHIRGR